MPQAQETVGTDSEKPSIPLIDNAPKKDEYKGWVKMTEDQMKVAQDNGTLIGYHPAKGLGLVKPEGEKKK